MPAPDPAGPSHTPPGVDPPGPARVSHPAGSVGTSPPGSVDTNPPAAPGSTGAAGTSPPHPGALPAPTAQPGALPAPIAHAVDTLVAESQATGRAPTLAVAVVRASRLLHVATAGDPTTVDTQFRIGSITKTLTAALILQLRDEGRLALDDLLYRHLPGTSVGGVTLRQLLGHVSGLQREPDGDWWERVPGRSLPQLLDGVGPDKLANPPQHGYHYSNLAYGLLGAVLERLCGQPWSELVDKRLLAPLGMHRTTYHPQPPYAPGYLVHPWYGTRQEEPRHDTGAMAPAGQLWSTLTDLARWAGFLAAGDPAVLSPVSVAQMCAPVTIVDPERWTAGHGLGLALWRYGERVYVGHGGSMPGYLAALVVHRPSGFGVVGFANAYTLVGTRLTTLAARVLTTVLDQQPPPPPAWRPAAHPPPPAVAQLCGTWWWMGREYRLDWDGAAGELLLTPVTVPGVPSRFRPERGGPPGDEWRGVAGDEDGEKLRVRRDDQDRIVGLELASLLFTRTPD